MLGTLPRGCTLPVLCVLFATCSGGPVKSGENTATPTAGPTTGTATPEKNSTLKCLPPAHRVILGRDEYEILPNGTLLVSNSSRSANASSYAVGEDGSATACLPLTECEEKSPLAKPFYYAFMSVFFFLQAPMFICGSRSFNRWNPLVVFTLVYTVALAYVAATLFLLPEYADAETVALWYSLPSYLTTATLHVSGCLAALHSDAALAFLARTGQIFVEKGTVYVRRVRTIIRASLAYAFFAFLFTYAFALCPGFDDGTGVEFSSLRNGMPFFLPTCAMLLAVNATLTAAGHLCPVPATISGEDWRRVRKRHFPYYVLFTCAFSNWIFGYIFTVTDNWLFWDYFVICSAILPIVLYCYIYENSRKVIYTGRRCFKILETDGDILTIWTHPPPKAQQGKAGTGNGKQPADKESGTGMGKQPADKESETEKKQPADKEYWLKMAVEGFDKRLIVVTAGTEEYRERQRETNAIEYPWAWLWCPDPFIYPIRKAETRVDNEKRIATRKMAWLLVPEREISPEVMNIL